MWGYKKLRKRTVVIAKRFAFYANVILMVFKFKKKTIIIVVVFIAIKDTMKAYLCYCHTLL